MTKTLQEQCSSLIDGELNDSECCGILDKISKDEELKSRLHRYYLIRDAVRTNLPDTINTQFTTSVMKALDAEVTILAPREAIFSSRSHLSRRLISFAIAASVATVAVFTYTSTFKVETSPQLAQMPEQNEFIRLPTQNSPDNTLLSEVLPANTTQQNPLTSKVLVSQPTSINSYSTVPELKLDPQLYKYIVNHNQHISSSKFQGVMPYTRIVVTATPTQENNKQ
jgi:negative regulator of sigma E activity